jgi:hypothetical protein
VTRSVTSRSRSRRVTDLAFKPHARGHAPSRPLHVTPPYKEWGARDREPDPKRHIQEPRGVGIAPTPQADTPHLSGGYTFKTTRGGREP